MPRHLAVSLTVIVLWVLPLEFRFDADAGSCEFEARVMRLLP